MRTIDTLRTTRPTRKSEVHATAAASKPAAYVPRTAQRRRPREGCPVVASNASLKCRVAPGIRAMPSHCRRTQTSAAASDCTTPEATSHSDTIATAASSTFQDRATRSRRLKVSEYSSSDAALITSATTKNRLKVANPLSSAAIQFCIIKKSCVALAQVYAKEQRRIQTGVVLVQ